MVLSRHIYHGINRLKQFHQRIDIPNCIKFQSNLNYHHFSNLNAQHIEITNNKSFDASGRLDVTLV